MTAWIQNLRLGRLAAAALLACLATALLAASAPAKPTPTANARAAALQKGVDGLVATGVPGAILFVRDGNSTLRLAAGFGDLGHKTPMNAGDHYKIASLTKTYTAAVVLQLVAEGKLRLSDSIERWVPGLVPNGGKITIRQLLNHTSGLAEFDTDPRYLKPYLSGDFGYYWAPRKLVQMGVSHAPLFPPGVTKHTHYANTNYVLLGLAVEAATGNSHRRRAAQPHLPASAPATARATRPSRACRARTRTATSWSASRRRPTSPVSARRSRRPPARSSPPPRTWPTSTARCSRGMLYGPICCGR